MNNWKDKLREMYFVDSAMHAEHEAFVESLLEEQRKEIQESGSALLDYQAQVIKQDLINQILQEMDEYDSRGSLKIVTKTDMRELLTKHLI